MLQGCLFVFIELLNLIIQPDGCACVWISLKKKKSTVHSYVLHYRLIRFGASIKLRGLKSTQLQILTL